MTTQQSIHPLHQFALEQLAFLEKEVEKLINRQETRQPVIECLLEMVQTFAPLGMGHELQQILNAYKATVKKGSKIKIDPGFPNKARDRHARGDNKKRGLNYNVPRVPE